MEPLVTTDHGDTLGHLGRCESLIGILHGESKERLFLNANVLLIEKGLGLGVGDSDSTERFFSKLPLPSSASNSRSIRI